MVRGLVAVGGLDPGAAVWTSVDGITWSRVPHDEAIFAGAFMNSVTVGGPGLVAVGSGAADGGQVKVWTSVDGITWSRVPQNESIFGVEMGSVTVGGPGLVAVGRSDNEFNVDLSTEVLEAKCSRGFTGAFSCSAAVVWTSLDGVTWSRALGNEADFFGGGMSSVTAGPSGLVAVGADEAGAAVWVTEEEG